MEPPTKAQVLALLRTGTPAERATFLAQLPSATLKDTVASLFESGHPGMVVVGITPLIQEYCFGSHPQIGAVLAEAVHERAREIVRTSNDHGLLPTTLSGLACHHVRALALLGRSAEVLAATQDYIPFYEQMNERENLSSLKVLRAEALVNLERIDEAGASLCDPALVDDPVNGIEARRLRRQVDRYRADPTLLRSEWKPQPAEPGAPDMLAILDKALVSCDLDSLDPALRRRLGANRLDPADPEQHRRLLDLLRDGEQLLTRGAGADSELAVRARIREATSIFRQGQPGPDAIRRSRAELEEALAQARRHGLTENENDALWGLYLCHNRLDEPSEAADALMALRNRLERLRHGIRDPLKRGGIFSTYGYLFNALCEQLYRSGRAADLLEAIESSKGRVIADRLTASAGSVMDDSAAYGSVASLPALTRREGFHYLTYFVDEACVYAAFVSKDGAILAPEPARVTESELRTAAAHVDPRQWPPGAVALPRQLAPLVSWLDGLLAQGIVAEGDHVCYSPDDDLNNVPLHCLPFRDGILLDHFSVSRVHSAFHLDRVLARELAGGPDAFAGFVVPLRQDLDRPDAETFLKHLDAPLEWLAGHGLRGSPVRLAEATPQRVARETLARRVVHFSTHGHFPPEGGNPFRDSFLLLADDRGLPDEARVGSGAHGGTLTPAGILDAALDLEGSHVSMMACVSGLAKEGIAGDALGLDWAFIQSGAASLVSSHWNVGAAAAARFFTHFYARWIDDEQPRAVAFRETVLDLLGADRSAGSLRRWAAFSLTGDFR